MKDPQILKLLADNPSLLETLKEFLEAKFDLETHRSDDTISDIQLGQMARARLVGLQKIEEAFKEIARMKSGSQSVGKRNEAR